jgi:hypothetical protein
MLSFSPRGIMAKALFFFWLCVTSPPLLLLIWLARSFSGFHMVVPWLGFPMVLLWLVGSWWLADRTASHMFEENRMFLIAVRHTWYDLRLLLSCLPIVGRWFYRNDDKDGDGS